MSTFFLDLFLLRFLLYDGDLIEMDTGKQNFKKSKFKNFILFIKIVKKYLSFLQIHDFVGPIEELVKK